MSREDKMPGNDVKRLYALGLAAWYDLFKRLWNKAVASKAEEELRSFLEKNINKDKTILELGCGTALNLETIYSLSLPFKRYLGLDFSSDMLKIARKKFKDNHVVTFKEKDITKLMDVKGKFDIIVCTWVLSHLQSPSTLVNEAQKLLSNDGKMFLIFFSKPKWYIHLWLLPLAKFLFRSNYLRDEEVRKFNNVKVLHKYSVDMVTTAQVYR